MKTHLPPRIRHGGFTYVAVVITMIIVGTMLAAYLKLVSVQNQSTMRSQAWNRTVPVLEAGVEEALAHLNKNAAANMDGTFTLNLTSDGWNPTADGGWQKTAQLGDDVYVTKITQFVAGNYYPFIQSVGYVKQLPTLSLNRNAGFFMADISLEQLISSGYVQRKVVCDTTNVPTYTKALVAKHGIDLKGNNVRTDSYVSTNSSYSTNGRYDLSKARDHGDIASNDTITNSVNVGNANIFGCVATGPRGTVAVGPQGCVGDAAYQANAANRGTIQANHSSDDMNVEFPDQVMPAIAWGAMPLGGTVDGVSYNYIFDHSGDYQMSLGTLSGKVLVAAPNVRLRIDTGWNFTGNDTLKVTTNASIIIYMNCSSGNIGGNGIVNTGRANQCYVLGTKTLRTLGIGGNGEISAIVNAPYADVTFNGSGNAITDFSGAAMANSFQFTGNFNFHYDEALPRIAAYCGYRITSWNER